MEYRLTTPCTAQSGQIDRAVADNGLLDSGIPLALADHNFVA